MTRVYNTTRVDGPDLADPRTLDWAERQAGAARPFKVVDGLPIHPGVDSLIADEFPQLAAGRGDLWHWGEACEVAAIVFGVGPGHLRHVPMIDRGDGFGWGPPHCDLRVGESPRAACVRALAEQTGLLVDERDVRMKGGLVVPDPRAGVNAWMVTLPGLIDLGIGDGRLPELTPGGGVAAAEWVPAPGYGELADALAPRGGLALVHDDVLRAVAY